jgi:hypothetical protein
MLARDKNGFCFAINEERWNGQFSKANGQEYSLNW